MDKYQGFEEDLYRELKMYEDVDQVKEPIESVECIGLPWIQQSF